MNYDYHSAKVKWHEICENQEYYIPLYHKDWYWDAVCDTSEEWKVVLYEDDLIIAAFPFGHKKIHGLWRIENPWQVSRGGIWFHYKMNNLSEEKKSIINNLVVEYMINALPYYDYFNINFLPQYEDCKPFFWNGFSISVNYNHFINSRKPEEVRSFCSKSKRNKINSSSKKYIVEVDMLSMDDFWLFFDSSLEKRGRKTSFSKERFLRLIDALKKKQSVHIRSARTKDGELVAVAVFFEDSGAIYHQFCAHASGNIDAQTLLTYSAIVYAMEKSKKFDFEGSMIKGVAEYNLSFSPTVENCHVIHNESKKYKCLDLFRQIIK